MLKRHATLLCEDYGEFKGIRDIRKHMAWYLKGFSVKQGIRLAMGNVEDLNQLDELIAQIDANQGFNVEVGAGPRGRTSGGRRPSLPDGWLNTPDLDDKALSLLRHAELSVSGG